MMIIQLIIDLIKSIDFDITTIILKTMEEGRKNRLNNATNGPKLNILINI